MSHFGSGRRAGSRRRFPAVRSAPRQRFRLDVLARLPFSHCRRAIMLRLRRNGSGTVPCDDEREVDGFAVEVPNLVLVDDDLALEVPNLDLVDTHLDREVPDLSLVDDHPDIGVPNLGVVDDLLDREVPDLALVNEDLDREVPNLSRVDMNVEVEVICGKNGNT
jgi:hypothetical protein